MVDDFYRWGLGSCVLVFGVGCCRFGVVIVLGPCGRRTPGYILLCSYCMVYSVVFFVVARGTSGLCGFLL